MNVLIFNEFTSVSGGIDTVLNAEISSFQKYGIEFELYPVTHKIKDIFRIRYFSVKKFQEAIDWFKPDIIHIHNLYQLSGYPVWDYIKTHGAKIILHLHNFYPFCLNSFFYSKGNPCSECLQKNSWLPGVIKKCYDNSVVRTMYASWGRLKPLSWVEQTYKVSALIAVSNFQARIYSDAGIHSSKIRVIENPVQTHSVPPEPGQFILFLGNIRFEKGIEIFCRCALLNPAVKFKAAGAGPRLKYLNRKYNHLGNLEFTGYAEGSLKEELLGKMKFLFVPSLCPETFGIGVLEAFSYGRPVLCSDSGNLSSLVRNGLTGRIYNENIPGKIPIAEFLEELESSYRDYAIRCFETARKYSIEGHMNKLISIYKSVI